MFLKKIQLVLTGPFKGYEKKEKKNKSNII